MEDPVTLAEFVLEGMDGWDRETIATHLGDGQRQVVRLKRPIPVHLLYWTAWADENGTVFFREDIYERDAPLMRALKEKPAPQVWAPTDRLPDAHPADVHVDKIGFPIIPDASLVESDGDFSKRRPCEHPGCGCRRHSLTCADSCVPRQSFYAAVLHS